MPPKVDKSIRWFENTMDSKTLASEIVKAGADKVLEKNPKRVDDAVANTVIKRGANALESGVSKGNVDPAVGAAAEVVNSQSALTGYMCMQCVDRHWSVCL